jgi:hypothetical protein
MSAQGGYEYIYISERKLNVLHTAKKLRWGASASAHLASAGVGGGEDDLASRIKRATSRLKPKPLTEIGNGLYFHGVMRMNWSLDSHVGDGNSNDGVWFTQDGQLETGDNVVDAFVTLIGSVEHFTPWAKSQNPRVGPTASSIDYLYRKYGADLVRDRSDVSNNAGGSIEPDQLFQQVWNTSFVASGNPTPDDYLEFVATPFPKLHQLEWKGKLAFVGSPLWVRRISRSKNQPTLRTYRDKQE